MNIFLQIQKHMNRHDGVFHFRYWTSKTDQYAKSYPDFSLGGPLNSGTQFTSGYPRKNQKWVVKTLAQNLF